ncbi:H-NS family nucleoid-associated regulatory protein [Azohydromonas caseinilytica]|uniref:H-NS histone family protein n=1 Tax=Azohydromonas caseinilytica TaxID=2728836 RepID=A0A848FIV0_9BURK|nr:H-NS family nucleoid-associated regulatory protein [Azohydromonas caseinilytica]NML18120.1 H-NS histone family protein [Azohydromonas caseinilytica]
MKAKDFAVSRLWRADCVKPMRPTPEFSDSSQLKMIEQETPTGWVKPVAKPTRESLKARIADLRAELTEAEEQLKQMEEDARLEALVKIRNLMRGFQLTPEDLGLEAAPKRRGRPRKVAA